MESNWVVLKFGGTSVVGKPNWLTIKRILQQRLEDGYSPLVVCSALSKVSNQLEQLIFNAENGLPIQPLLDSLIQKHLDFATELDVNANSAIGDIIDDLRTLFRGVELIQEVSPKLKARLMSSGELLSTRLAAAWLNHQNMSTHWLDARTVLKSQPQGDSIRDFTSATCTYSFDLELKHQLEAINASVVVTQGFIASDTKGRTVLLGRGGSDTSASYFAVKLNAKHLEIWTDVPGLFTANPHAIPSARLIKQLDYDEAQEMASTGAKALHPRCIPPIKEANIPLQIGCTKAPEIQGTRIGKRSTGAPGLKSISIRKGLALISMDTVGMWQQVGFLANVFGIFKQMGLSIDLVATSEANVTVSLDPSANTLDTELIDRLMGKLSKYCQPAFIGSAASISLVGGKIRAILHQLGPVFERFADQKVHLLTQAASDLNLTFVVDEDQADGLVRSLHAKLFAMAVSDPDIGPTWTELFSPPIKGKDAWWRSKRKQLLELASNETPLFVYSKQTLVEQANSLLSLKSIDTVFYAVKANPNPDILRLFYDLNLGFECVSPEEIHHVKSILGDIPKHRLLFTPNFAPKEDYVFGFNNRAMVTLDSLFPLKKWPDIFKNQEIVLRLDPGKGQGHHKYVVTAGSNSKFGVPSSDIEQVVSVCNAYNISVVGLHAHAGSGIVDETNWKEKALFLARFSHYFPDLRFLNLGGGFGVVERRGQKALDLNRVDDSLSDFKAAHPKWKLWIEPGRFLVSEAGVLLSTVTQVKAKGERFYVGVDAGMNTLIRPALYGAWHEIHSLSRLESQNEIIADVVGPICESGDVMGRDRTLPVTDTGDVFLTETAGAYGRSMSSFYNMRPPANETLIE